MFVENRFRHQIRSTTGALGKYLRVLKYEIPGKVVD
jgi:hypothetical protein